VVVPILAEELSEPQDGREICDGETDERDQPSGEWRDGTAP